jgi:hypothetical protein
MRRLCERRIGRRLLLVVMLSVVGVAFLGLVTHPAAASARSASARTASARTEVGIVRSSAVGSNTLRSSAVGSSGSRPSVVDVAGDATPSGARLTAATFNPTPIQVGPTGTSAPTAPTPGSGGTVSDGSPPSPGFFDIPGQIEAAIDGWMSGLVTDALNPVLNIMGHTLLATPAVTDQSQVGHLWLVTAGIADAFLVLLIMVGGAIVMTHETLQTRTALKDVLPRIVVAGIAVNASLGLAGLAISIADTLSQAVLGQGVDPTQATTALRQLVLGSLSSGGIFLVILGAVVAVLAVVLLATYVVRLALVILLVVAAPLALVCHALPQTEGIARLWWRAFSGCLVVQLAQSLVLVAALRIFLSTHGPANLGIASSGGLVNLLVSACLCWVLVKIPTWVGRRVFSSASGGRRRSGFVRNVVLYKGIKALAGVGL